MRRSTSFTNPRRMCRGWLLAAAVATALAGCKSTQPTLTLEGMAVQRLSLRSAEFLATWRIDNPNPWAIHVQEMPWTLSGGGQELAQGAANHPTEVPASDSAPLYMHIELPYARLPDGQTGGQIAYRLTGLANFTSPMGSVSAPFAAEGQMPVIRELELGRPTLSVIGVTATRVGLRIELDVRNPNAMWLAPDRLCGALLINQRALVDLDEELAGAEPIGPATSGRLDVTAWVSSPEVGVKSLADLIRTPGADCRLRGDLRFRALEHGQVEELLLAPGRPAPTN